jgi:hypothetical protein
VAWASGALINYARFWRLLGGARRESRIGAGAKAVELAAYRRTTHELLEALAAGATGIGCMPSAGELDALTRLEAELRQLLAATNPTGPEETRVWDRAEAVLRALLARRQRRPARRAMGGVVSGRDAPAKRNSLRPQAALAGHGRILLRGNDARPPLQGPRVVPVQFRIRCGTMKAQLAG